MLEKITTKESTQIDQNGRIRVTYRNQVLEDGVEVTSFYSVETIDPTKDTELSDNINATLKSVDAEIVSKKELPEMKLDEKYSAMPVTEVVIDP